MEIVIAALALVVAVVAVALVLRRPAADDQTLAAVRNDLNVLRETTERSLGSVNTVFATQLQSIGSNVQTALASVAGDMHTRLDSLSQNVAQRLNENVQAMTATSSAVGDRIAHVQATFAELQKQVGEMSEQARQLADMSRAVVSLERVLSAPKLRGGFGEAQLENLLAQVFADEQYHMQYKFPSGDVADAVVDFGHAVVAIDSKFPLENFRRMAEAVSEEEKKALRREFLKDVRKRIDEIAARYIRPADGTLPFALMYVPAENVYYEAIIRDEEGNDLYSYCVERKVIPVSPNSLYAYLQTIVVGLNGMRISQRAESILKEIGSLRVEVGKFAEAYSKVGSHLRNAGERFNDSTALLNRVETRVQALAAGGGGQAELFEEEKEKARSLAAGSS